MIAVNDSGIGSSPEQLQLVSTQAMLEFQQRHHHRHGKAHEMQHTMTRTHQYRKVMKPLLERKRRARINKCLDELKDIMVTALQTEGESITKLEKADVLELTVRHLQKLKRHNALDLTPQATYAGRFKAGYTHCAQQVSAFMTHTANVDVHVSTRLVSHLSSCVQALETISPSALSSSSSSPSGGNVPSRPTPIRPRSPTDLARMDAYRKAISDAECGFDDDKAWRPW